MKNRKAYMNGNIPKPRNADNDVYEKQHQFNASKTLKMIYMLFAFVTQRSLIQQQERFFFVFTLSKTTTLRK